eukprot:10282771-Ditylum_brightwellii.AAC.1
MPEIVTQCHKDLKAKSLAAMKIKIKLLQKKIQSNYIKAIHYITECFIVNNSSSHLVHDTVAVLIDNHHERIIVHTGLTKQAFNA